MPSPSETFSKPRETVSPSLNRHNPSNICLLWYLTLHIMLQCVSVLALTVSSIMSAQKFVVLNLEATNFFFVILHKICWLLNEIDIHKFQKTQRMDERRTTLWKFRNWTCISYRYSAPHPFTKLILMVHILVSWYTASKPWLTDWARRAANSWLLKIFRLQPMIEKSKRNLWKSIIKRK